MSYLLRTSRTPAKLVIARSAASVRSFTTSTTLKLKESDRRMFLIPDLLILHFRSSLYEPPSPSNYPPDHHFSYSESLSLRQLDGERQIKLTVSPDTDNLGEQNEKHKQDQLQKQKKGEGHWKPELASDSEEAVAADRHEHSDHSQDGIKELQRKTKDHAEEKHKTGTSQDTGL
ncbi:MAG: hypothetical protein M1818_001875 [Claussenomyces sp. TS43310]|nr:MAG: hypothetical protein M1818_001875 [Claussenomyces sp. TS43310]